MSLQTRPEADAMSRSLKATLASLKAGAPTEDNARVPESAVKAARLCESSLQEKG